MNSEARNPRTREIDVQSTLEAVSSVLAEDAAAVGVAQSNAAALAVAIDAAATRLLDGGRLHYFGAGASGRIGMLDATELGPTFGVPDEMVTAHFAGGDSALVDPYQDLEDDVELGARDAGILTLGDVAVGITASGRTPYVQGALDRARASGALTILLTCAEAPLIDADLTIALPTGPEAITGSTRLKAGTATKCALNAFSTVLMVRLGRTHSNLMTGVRVSNEKLQGRAARIVHEVTGAADDEIDEALTATGWRVDAAIVSLLAGVPPEDAMASLEQHRSVRESLKSLGVRP